ncbi:MAG: penicillin-binding transpeptidase domain-containing protein [Spirochaetota bacterium]
MSRPLQVIFFFSALFLPAPLPASSFEAGRIDAALDGFSRANGECAAVLLHARSGRIEYIYNRAAAVSRRYPPGSIAKGWSAAVLLDYGAQDGFSPAERIICEGKFFPPESAFFQPGEENLFNLIDDPQKGERYFKCSLAAGHGKTDLRKALIESCNVYFLTQASRMNGFYEKYISVWRLDDTLAPGSFSSAEPILRQGTPFLKTAAAIGEGGLVQVSPLKAAQCYAALFEDTPLLLPFEGSGTPSVRQELPVSLSARRFIRTALSRTVTEGTLKKLTAPAGIKILAGKTGTGTHYRKKYASHGWNVLWLETGGERYVLVTFVAKGSGPAEAAALSGILLNNL